MQILSSLLVYECASILCLIYRSLNDSFEDILEDNNITVLNHIIKFYLTYIVFIRGKYRFFTPNTYIKKFPKIRQKRFDLKFVCFFTNIITFLKYVLSIDKITTILSSLIIYIQTSFKYEMKNESIF
ncbi:hypothetical protein A0H76_2273 [Hepatospora eriocheir]|uniref:Uncharacterized protein n=1 Tax=Hepatospora eriocheir TaxID=1081669 RepID=A0A1X0QFJ6_9MICR|nr:hypothetical protein A0H76_2273 [Hepatospora eriocheir]